MTTLPPSIQADIDDVAKIAIVPSILDVVCRTTGMGFACIARVTEDKWIACTVLDNVAFGLAPGGELKLDTTICHEIRQHRQPVVIDHVSEDPAYAHHHTPLLYGLQSYISVPIILKDGSFFGTLCAIDAKPAVLDTPQVRKMFDCFVDLIAVHLDNIRQKQQAESDLSEEKATGQLREGFIAILGHDLRNPLSAIKSSAEVMDQLKQYNAGLIKIISKSTSRIQDLIETMLDLARGRLAGGIQASLTSDNLIQDDLQQVIDELQVVWPHKTIVVSMQINRPLLADHARIAQLFSNLLGNALKYGDNTQPVKIKAFTTPDRFELSVSNAGKKIAAERLDTLVKPFSRGEGQEDKPGLGLGLYIANEIALSHKGTLTVRSTEEETCFVFSMPA